MNIELKKIFKEAKDLNIEAFSLQLQNFCEDFIKRHQDDNKDILSNL